MKNITKLIVFLLIAENLILCQVSGKEIAEKLNNSTLAYIEIPLGLSGDSSNPIITINNEVLYRKLVNYIEKRTQTDVKSKSMEMVGIHELAMERRGILIHLMDIENPEVHKETISVERDFIRIEDNDKIREYLKDTNHLEALIFTLGIEQGVFKKLKK